jgi:hypothetical protein
MSHDGGKDGGKSREELALEANQVRRQLLHTVEQLDSRRQQVKRVRVRLEQTVRHVVVYGAATILATAGVAALVAWHVASSAQRRRRERWRLARGVWRHPERVMRGPPPLAALLRTVLLSAASSLATIAVRRALLGRPPFRRAPQPAAR